MMYNYYILHFRYVMSENKLMKGFEQMKLRTLILASLAVLTVLTAASCGSGESGGKSENDGKDSKDSYSDAPFEDFEEYGSAEKILKDYKKGFEGEAEENGYDVNIDWEWEKNWDENFIEYYEEETGDYFEDISGKPVTLVLEASMDEDEITVCLYLVYEDSTLVPEGYMNIYDGDVSYSVDESEISGYIKELTAYSEASKKTSGGKSSLDKKIKKAAVASYSDAFDDALESWAEESGEDVLKDYSQSWKTEWDDEFTDEYISWWSYEDDEDYTEKDLKDLRY